MTDAPAATTTPRLFLVRKWLAGPRSWLVLAFCAGTGVALAFGSWRIGAGGTAALAVAALSCGVACAAGLCMLDRGKRPSGACHAKSDRPGH